MTRRKTWGAAFLLVATFWTGVAGGVMVGCQPTDDKPTHTVTVRPSPTRVELPPTLADALGGADPQEVPLGWAQALAQEPGQGGRDWSLCDFYLDGDTRVVCPDGYTFSS
ncbi:hypothetical protein [Micromonospora sp. NPDC049240]|uniref:hypothetical protein n=1 Tax=Micromonospora sp. NPDC049240 TaxID=3155151 RepID=UPI0033C03533